MSLGLSPLNLFPIDTANPVNWQHELNKGKILWYLSLPGQDGGRLWFDLLNLRHGTLTSMVGVAGNGWRSNTRPGALGNSLLMDGVAGHVVGPTFVGPSAGYSCFCWVRVSNVANTQMFTSLFTDAGAYSQFFNTATGVVHGRIENVSTTLIGRATAGNAIANNVWAHIGFTWSGAASNSGIVVYVNGIASDTTNDGGGAFVGSSGTALPFQVGCQTASSAVSVPLAGNIDDVQVYNRGLSATEAWSVYDLSRSGNPGVLNRVDSWLWAQPAPPPFRPAWAARANVSLGMN